MILTPPKKLDLDGLWKKGGFVCINRYVFLTIIMTSLHTKKLIYWKKCSFQMT